MNEGDTISDTREGPRTLQEGDGGAYPWVNPSLPTGICFQRSEIRTRDVSDGLSQTYLLGEKYISSLQNLSGSDNTKFVVFPADIPAAIKGLMGR